MICKDCGKFVSAKDGEIIDGNFICNDCLEVDYIKCADCGKYHVKDFMTFIYGKGEYVCDDCLENNGYFYCEDCGRWFDDTDAICTEDTKRYVCEDCARLNYYQCSDCGRWFENIAMADYNTALCNDCLESGEWGICDDCGSIVRIDNMYSGNDGQFHCANCISEHSNNTIKPYHSVNYWDYRFESDEQNTTNDIYYGFEIEVGGDKGYAEEVDSKLNGHAILMEDGSVEGFEIVTDPMTKKYYYNSFMPILKDTMEYLKEKGFRGRDAGGIHIHISENACNNWEGIRTLLNYNNIDLWIKLTQRKELNLQQYAQLYSYVFNGQNTRYQALNYDSRTDTYEFRIFNSNLRVERITKNFEIVLSLIDFVNNNIVRHYTDIKEYIKFVKDNKKQYQNLYNFMIEKELQKKVS